MANFITAKPPTQPTYVFEFTQDEVDVLAGIVLDLTDKVRKVQMDYTVDGSPVVPSERGHEVLKAVGKAFGTATSGSLDYDYFDFWDEVEKE